MTTGVGPRFDAVVSRPPPTEGMGMNHVLFVEIGMGADQHGQDATKAAVRACRNAIEFNSIPSIRQIVPGGYDNMKLHIQIGVPKGAVLDLEKIRRVFPYGQICEPIEVVEGGLMARSGIKIPEMETRATSSSSPLPPSQSGTDPRRASFLFLYACTAISCHD